MIRRIKDFLKHRDALIGRSSKTGRFAKRRAGEKDMQEATRYVGARFGRAITRLSER